MPADSQPHRASPGNRIEIVWLPGGGSEIARVEGEFRFGWWHLQSARFLVRESKRKDAIEAERFGCISGAIVMSWCLVEAVLYEFTHLWSRDHRSPLNDTHQQIIWTIVREGLAARSASALEQFNMYLRIIGAEQFDTGKEPYQRANLVRELRNRIVHPVPESFLEFDKDDSVVDEQKLVRKLRPQLGLRKGATFPKDVLTPATAEWALESVIQFLEKFEASSKVQLGFLLRCPGDSTPHLASRHAAK